MIRFFKVCPFWHDHPNGEGYGDCMAAYRSELARLAGGRGADGQAPCCGHDPVVEHEPQDDGAAWCFKCCAPCPELKEGA